MVLNTGSTSTKMAVYFDDKKVTQKEFEHTKEFLEKYPYMSDQLPMRQELADDFMKESAEEYGRFDAIVARGGILPPIHAGGYEINDVMVDYLLNVCAEEHASNVAACIAFELRQKYGIPHAYIYDGISTDELEPIARISGIPDMPRVSVTHCLNMRATAHRAAADMGKAYGDCTFIVAHLGGGISASVHRHGEIIDSVGDDDGQFSPERSGCVPSLGLIKLCYSGKYTYEEMRKKIRGRGGMYAHLGTSDCRVIEQMIRDGDRHADLIFQAQAYQIAKAIGLLSIVLKGDCDAIILTGGVANSKMLTERVEDYVKFIAPVCVMPGENEMEALALGGMRILQGEENARIYHIVNGVNGKEGQG